MYTIYNVRGVALALPASGVAEGLEKNSSRQNIPLAVLVEWRAAVAWLGWGMGHGGRFQWRFRTCVCDEM